MGLNYIRSFFAKDPSMVSGELPMYPSVTKCILHSRGSQTIVCDIRTMLRSESFFPFFMLVAYEGGSMIRAFLLLLSWPVLWVLSSEFKLRVMIFITFCGLRSKDMQRVARTVLPKFYLENLNPHVYEVFASAGSRQVFTSVPNVMVEGFLKEYLSADSVKGTELQTVGQFFNGFVSSSGLLLKHSALKEIFGENNGAPDVGIGSSNLDDDLEFISLCKEAYVVGREDVNKVMPRDKYPKPLIFHDVRLAFLPTPLAMLDMFLWLPFGLLLAIFRLSVGALMPFLPCELVIMLYTFSGIQMRLNVINPSSPKTSQNGKGVLYVCNHRNNADPAFLLLALNNNRPLTSVVYGVSKIFQLITPLRLVSLSRSDRSKDAKKIHKLLSEGDLVIFPEGTTCREPYILRFSSLFAELTDDIVPVAVNLEVGMFYGATASGFFKVLDGLFLAMNPRLYYSIQVLEKLPKEFTVGGGKSIHEVANNIQSKLAHELGFECSTLRRKDKYMMLAGTEGIIQQ